MLNNEDLRWLEIIKQVVDGLQAQAEIQSEACDREWMAMLYSLEGVSETLKSCIEDYKERLGVVDDKDN